LSSVCHSCRDKFSDKYSPPCVYCKHNYFVKGLKVEKTVKDSHIALTVADDTEPVANDKITVISGVGKDEETVVNEQGGAQAKAYYRFDLMDAKALFALGKVLYEGAEKYGENNWRKISVNDHINHALIHIYAYLAGDEQDEHLEHAFCRLMMALGVRDNGKK
jgi:hypothetical protein